jgi:hypothetical protein
MSAMKTIILIDVISVLLAAAAEAATFTIGVQYTLPSGFSSQWSGLNGGGCGSPNGGGRNCSRIPVGTSVRECTGTQTIKVSGIELLARIVCGTSSGFETIWRGHHLSTSPTVRIQTPRLSAADSMLQGSDGNTCWVEYQANNAGPEGGGWEMQLTCVAE